MDLLEPRLFLAATPIISEILASNQHTITDQSGNYADWIEIANPDSRQSVDMTGWKLKYKSTTWNFPSFTLGPNQYRVIFADSLNLTDPAGDLHTNFNLSKSGANLSLLDPNNNTVESYSPYPAGSADVSYGVGQTVSETKLISTGATASWLVPTSGTLGQSWTQAGFNDGSWSKGATGLGFANVVAGLAATVYKASIGSIGNLAQAQSVVNTPSSQAWVKSETAPVINYLNTGGSGDFVNDRTFPGMNIGVDQDVFVLTATGTVHIPSAGQWTFGVNSDDGFSLNVGGQSMAFDGLRGASDTLSTFTFPAAGDYPLSLLFFENGGGSGVELFAAQGSKSSFDSSFRLVGDTAKGGLSISSVPLGAGNGGNNAGFASDIRTNVKSAMQAAGNASLYTRIKFDAPNLASLQSLTLKMAYDDGYVAYLNGVEVARRNAPASVTWNSAATSSRTTDLAATTFENVDLTSSIALLQPTGNVLAIQALNASAGDADMLIMPELSQMVVTAAGNEFFSTPTPGAPNTPDTWQPDIQFSSTHGFYDQPFQLTLSSTLPSAQIYYTLDGSAPSPSHGTLYTGPIAISKTTAVRAVSSLPGGQTSVSSTETYIFLDNVINQSNSIPGFPASWGSQPADYAMDPRITTDPAYSGQLKQDLLSIPTMSIVMDQSDLFDPSTGIYSHPDTPDLTRAASLEYILPDGTSQGFQINAAVQMEGGAGRGAQFEKHSFRFFFKSGYGPTKLVYDLFGDGATDTFDNLTLRAGFNDTWSWGDNRTQFLRNQFADNTFLDMGELASHGTFVQLYVNGVYWGLYNPLERPDSTFSSQYMGGEKEDYDVINSGIAANGTTGQSWNDLMSFFDNNDVSTTAGYQKLQGNNPDGTRNPAYPDLLDVSNYVDYMLMNFYIGNTDWPNHNYYATRLDTADSTGFKMFPWDSEMAMDGGWASFGTDSTGVGSTSNDIAKPYYYLRNNPDFRMLLADRVQKYMYNNGALTPAATAARYKALADEVQGAIVTESARWGDIPSTSGTVPHTEAQWANERDYLYNTFFPQRTSLVIQQLRNQGVIPTFDAPSFSINGTPQYGGTFNPNDVLTISGSGGTIYYTLNGADPRLPGGAINPAALSGAGPITLAQGTEVKARLYVNGTWSALADASFYVDLAPAIRITEVMYNPPAPSPAEVAAGYIDNNDFEYIEIQNVGNKTLPLGGLRLSNGVDFTFPNISIAPNQYVLVVSNLAAFELRYPSVSPSIIAGEYTGHLDSAGEPIELDAPSGGIIHDFKYSDGWYSQTDGGGFSLTVRDPLQDRSLWDKSEGWRSSAAPGGSPGGSDSLPLPDVVAINEVQGHASSPQDNGIELLNTTDQPIDISGWFLSDSATDLARYQLPAGTVLSAGGLLVLTQGANFANPADAGDLTPFSLSADGGDVYLSSNAGGQPGGYRTHVSYGAAPVGISSGRVVKSTGSSDFALLASPTLGAANDIPYIAPLVINEIMYNPAPATPAEVAAGFADNNAFEFIELYNRSGAPLDLSSFSLADGVSFSFSGSSTILAPGAYVVLVSNPAAFDFRYHIAANNIPVGGTYTGRLDDGGEWVRLFQNGPAEAGGFVPQYEVDRVNYNDHAPWPGFPDGQGPALERAHVAGYGNDPLNWTASNVGGTPGKANIPIDTSAPSIPANLVAQALLNPARIVLGWSAAQDDQSAVDHYVIYRDGQLLGTSAAANYSDTPVSATISHTYRISAVNRDGFESVQSNPITIALPGVLSTVTTDTTHIQLRFTEPLNPAVAQSLLRYSFSGGAIGAVSLSLNNTQVTLTTSSAMVLGQNYTLTLSNLTTASGNQLPVTIPISFQYAPAGLGYILREYWAGVGGSTVPDLTSNAAYPFNPTGRSLQTSFEGPSEFSDNYGDRFQGYLFPPQTGNYTFWIASDDASELWLSTDDNPANAVKIAYVAAWTSSREWTKEPNQQSASIHLEAGHKYYIESIHKEGGGGDNLAVRWQLPDGTWENNDPNQPIPGIRLAPYGGLDITAPSTPANLRAKLVTPTSVTLNWSAAFDQESGIDHYVLYRDGAVYNANITSTTFTDTAGINPQSRHSYQVAAVNGGGFAGTLSPALTLVPTGIASVVSYSATSVVVTFTEPVSKAAAEQASNYTVSGASLVSASLASDNLTLALTTSAMTLGQAHTLTVKSMSTLSGNAFPANSQASFTYGGSILYQYWLGLGAGNAVTDLTSNPAYPNNPSGSQYLTSFEAPTNWQDAFGAAITGYVIPTTTGDYTFWIASDDNSELWLSTDETPAHAAKIASVPVWTSPRAWTTYPQQQSSAIHLIGGQRYYIQALMKEGGGGDNLAVAWQRSGTAFSGLPIPGANLAPYAPPVTQGPGAIAVTQTVVHTPDSTPALGGTIDDPAASVTVTVAGTAYAATNNGNGTWTLANDAITPALADGSYPVLVTAIDQGNKKQGYASLAAGLVIDTLPPILSPIAIQPNPRTTPLAQLQIAFNEPVVGLTLANLHLTRNNASDLLTNAQTLTSSDGTTWTLSNLSGLTAAPGQYALTLTPNGIADPSGNGLSAGTSSSFTVIPTTISGTDGPDHYTLSLDPSGTQVQFFLKQPTSGQPDFSVPRDLLDSSLTFDLGGGDDTLTITSDLGFAPTFKGGTGEDTLEISAGTYALADQTLSGTANLHLVLSDSATATAPASATVIRLAGLGLAGSSKLDLGRADLILPYAGSSPLGSLAQWVKSGQLFSSDSNNPALSSFVRTLAVWDNQHTRFSIFDGQSLADFNQVLVKYTYFGDSNLDGMVTPKDYAIVDGNIGPGHDWAQGDLNGDGNTTPADYALIDGNIGAGTGANGGPELVVSADSIGFIGEKAAIPITSAAEPEVDSVPMPISAAAAPFSTSPISSRDQLLDFTKPALLL